MKLFRNRVFSAAGSIGFVMGFAMFGALTFLPLFMQNVKLVSPTVSGLRILPLMVGMLGASVTPAAWSPVGAATRSSRLSAPP